MAGTARRGRGLPRGTRSQWARLSTTSGRQVSRFLLALGMARCCFGNTWMGQWGGEAASAAYRGPIAKVLKSEYPGRKSFTILEDNDPSGFKSSSGRAAKEASKISVLEIPKRSPCLNVCDYFLWSAVNRRMREQEQAFPVAKREKRVAFLKRLRRTALGLPSDVVAGAVGDMKRRCVRLQKANGGNIEEGGKSQ